MKKLQQTETKTPSGEKENSTLPLAKSNIFAANIQAEVSQRQTSNNNLNENWADEIEEVIETQPSTSVMKSISELENSLDITHEKNLDRGNELAVKNTENRVLDDPDQMQSRTDLLHMETYDTDTNSVTHYTSPISNTNNIDFITIEQLTENNDTDEQNQSTQEKIILAQTELIIQNNILDSQQEELSDFDINETDNHITDLETLLQEEKNYENLNTTNNNTTNMDTDDVHQELPFTLVNNKRKNKKSNPLFATIINLSLTQIRAKFQAKIAPNNIS
ncbi:10547_t:CDS:2 [Cetraspora pellucida]|uniref:10547_t:CDS:1 n=1 Tax=Cetraspora pellucida TaxID=1433469 RepID=A0A9N9EKI7_9GLOM|nr:10547_t:CDS:2 [Cetraspora pellucida]